MTETILTLSVVASDGQAIPVARVQSRQLARKVAQQAVVEAELRAQALRRMSPVLGRLGASEAHRLGRAMQTILGQAS